MPSEDRSIVGDLINFRGLVYAPLNENGVVFLFGKVAHDLNMYVEEIKPGFPDCIARRFTGKGWERVAVEFEFRSSNFKSHGHDVQECDVIVCWEHDWNDCPLEVIELKSQIKAFPNIAITKPIDSDGDAEENLRKMFSRFNVSADIQRVYPGLEKGLLGFHDEVWRKVAKHTVTFYSPSRVFVYVKLRGSSIRLFLFTRGAPTDNVKPAGEKSPKWGRMLIKTDSDVAKAVAACKEAWQRMQAAVAANENTMGRLEAEEESDDTEELGDAEAQEGS